MESIPPPIFCTHSNKLSKTLQANNTNTNAPSTIPTIYFETLPSEREMKRNNNYEQRQNKHKNVKETAILEAIIRRNQDLNLQESSRKFSW